MFLFCIGTIRLACSLAVHYEKQQEQSEDKPHKGRWVYNRNRVFISILCKIVNDSFFPPLTLLLLTIHIFWRSDDFSFVCNL